MRRNERAYLLIAGTILCASVWLNTPAAWAQSDKVTITQAQQELRQVKFQIDRVKKQLTVLTTQVNQITNLAVRIRSTLGEVLSQTAAARSQGQIQIALKKNQAAQEAIACTLPHPDSAITCKFKNAEGENVGILELARAAMRDPDNSVISHIETLKEMIQALKDQGNISSSTASKIDARLNKIETDLDPIDEILDSIEEILGNGPDGVQQFFTTIENDLDQGDVSFDEVIDARLTAAQAVGVARDPDTKEPTFLTKALAGTRLFPGLARKMITDFAPLGSLLRAALSGFSSEALLAGNSIELERLFDLGGRSVEDGRHWEEAIQALSVRFVDRALENEKAYGIYIGVIVRHDQQGQIVERRIIKILLKI